MKRHLSSYTGVLFIHLVSKVGKAMVPIGYIYPAQINTSCNCLMMKICESTELPISYMYIYGKMVIYIEQW